MSRYARVIVILLIALLILPVIGLALLSFFSPKPASLGVVNGRLAPCPDSPNCVCSQAPESDTEHYIAPLKFEGSSSAAFERLATIITGMGAKIDASNLNYLHAEFTTRIFRFVDDVEFMCDPETQTIHVRSASRAGKSDLGVNRRRVEEIRAAFNASRS